MPLAMYWASTNGNRVSPTVRRPVHHRPARWRNLFEPTLGGTLYYNEAYQLGIRIDGALTRRRARHSATAATCAHACVHAVGIGNPCRDLSLHSATNVPVRDALATRSPCRRTLSSTATLLDRTVSSTPRTGARARDRAATTAPTPTHTQQPLVPWPRAAEHWARRCSGGEVLIARQRGGRSASRLCRTTRSTATCSRCLAPRGRTSSAPTSQYPHPPPSPPLPPAAACRRCTRRCHPTSPSVAPATGCAPGRPSTTRCPSKTSDGQYSLTCGMPTSCGIIPLPIFRGDFLGVVQLSRELQRDYRFDASLCPWECIPRSSSTLSEPRTSPTCGRLGHRRSHPQRRAQQRAPRTPRRTAWSFREVAEFAEHDDSMSSARRSSWGADRHPRAASPIATGMMGSTTTSQGQTGSRGGHLPRLQGRSLAHAVDAVEQLGDARQQPDAPWPLHASQARAPRVPDEVRRATTWRAPINCVWWAEFDDDHYNCRPESDPQNMLQNVLTPLKMIETLEIMGLHYPPPSPPPPTPAVAVAAAPAANPLHGRRAADAAARSASDHLDRDWKCWRWIKRRHHGHRVLAARHGAPQRLRAQRPVPRPSPVPSQGDAHHQARDL